MKINARLDLHAAAGDTEIDGNRRAELECGFDFLDAFRSDPEREKSAAAEQRNGQTERALPLGEIEAHLCGLAVKRQREARAERDVFEREDADSDRRDAQRVPRGD